MRARNVFLPVHRRLGDEQGSMVIALLAMVIASGLMVTVATYAFTGMRAARFDRAYTSVVQGADAGVHEALYRLGLPAGNPNRITAAVPLTPWQTLGAFEYQYSVTPVAAQWKVDAFGRTNGTTRRVRALLAQNKPFAMAAFADNRLTLVGDNKADSYNGTTWDTDEGNVGSNGTVTINGNALVDDVELHDYDANSTNRCLNPSGTYCSNADTFGPKMDISSEGALGFITDALAANCPATPTVWRASTGPLLAGGTYCFSRMEFDADVNFTGTSAAPTYVYLTGQNGFATISVPNKRRVNCPTCAGTTGPRPEAQRLQIFTAAYGDVRFGNYSHFAGAVFAPRASCRGNPSNAQAQFYGSLVCRTITNQGGWTFHYDEQLRDVGAGSFDIIRWSED